MSRRDPTQHGPVECVKCGQPHVTRYGGPSCAGHSNGRLRPEIAGKPCRQTRVRGTTMCRMHGGAAPQVKAAGEARVEAAKQQEAVARLALTFGGPLPGRDPADVIAEQIDWRYGHVQWLRARVQTVDPDALVWGRTREKTGGDDWGSTSEAKPNAWLELYHKWSVELEKLCLEALRLGLDERRVRLAEKQGQMVVRLIEGLLADLGLDAEDPKVAEVVERRLRLLPPAA